MKAALKRDGDQVTVTFPLEVAEASGLHQGSDVEITSERDSIVIRRRKVTLQEILDSIDGPIGPLEWDDVKPAGSEVW